VKRESTIADESARVGRLASIGLNGPFVDEIVDALPDPLFFLGRTGGILHANRAGCALLGSALSHVVGRSIEEVLLTGPFDNTLIAEALDRKVTVSGTYNVQDGRRVLLSARPLAVGDSQIVVLAVSGLSPRVAAGPESAGVQDRPEIDDGAPVAIVAQSRMLAAVRDRAERCAAVDSSVLLLGETGTGKSLFARLIHRESRRSRHAFKTVACGGIPAARLEAELFGSVADGSREAGRSGTVGLIELAHHGTLVLDGVSELPPALQLKLLRFLESGEVWPVGASTPRRKDVRIIATASQDLRRMIGQRIFREDLFYRLGALVVQIPPLREHPDDIPPLIELLLDRLSTRLGIRKRMAPEAIEAMKRRPFPGNVRELENTVEGLMLTVSGEIIGAGDVDTDDVEPTLPSIAQLLASERVDLRHILQDVEAMILREALRRFGTQARAAQHLGIAQATVARKSKQYGLTA
jgi:transcriptional regulator with PAS, ATPase and Fis domain